jgi:lysophospholipase L1-like esterase
VQANIYPVALHVDVSLQYKSMMKQLLTLLLAMVILPCVGQDKELPPPDYGGLNRYKAANEKFEATPEDRVVFLGNSITDAWAYVDTAFFADNNFVGRGISGQTSPQLLVRFRQDVIDLQPKIVIIHIGTNDIAENTGPYNQAFTLGNIISMVDLAEKNGMEAIIASVLPATQFSWRPKMGDPSAVIIALNEKLQALASDRGLKYIDYHTALKNDANGMDVDLAKDGVHPTMKAYEIMAKLALKALKE